MSNDQMLNTNYNEFNRNYINNNSSTSNTSRGGTNNAKFQFDYLNQGKRPRGEGSNKDTSGRSNYLFNKNLF
jgi:hypothetical protein